MTDDLSALDEHIALTRAARAPGPSPYCSPSPAPPPASAAEFKEATDEMTALRERSDLAGDMGAHLLDGLYASIGDQIRLPCGDFKVLYAEDLAEFGIRALDEPYPPLYLKRKSDGAVFEVEVECEVRRLERKKAGKP